MGQQQLLLIVLGVIIVGIAVVVGINVFTASSASSNRDGVISDMTNIGSMAQTFYRKPLALGGGNNTFTGFQVGTLDSTANGTYSAAVTAQQVTITGIGNQQGNNGSAPVQATMIVTPTGMTTTVNN